MCILGSPAGITARDGGRRVLHFLHGRPRCNGRIGSTFHRKHGIVAEEIGGMGYVVSMLGVICSVNGNRDSA